MNKKLDPRILAEIAALFALMLSVKWVADSVALPGAGSIAMWCGIMLATGLMKGRGASWRELGLIVPGGRKEWLATFGLALLTVISVFVVMAFVIAPITAHFGLETPPDAADRFRFFLGKPVLFFAYLVAVVWFGAALGEELVMRGFVLNRLAEFFGLGKSGWSAAVLIHAAIFGALHAYQGVQGVITTGVVGMIIAVVYLLGKRRLMPVILGHGIIDTISLTAFYLSGGVIT